MVASQLEFATFRVSTDDLPERDRIAAYRESYGRTIIKQDVELLPDCPLHFAAALYVLPGLGVVSGICSPLRGHHASRHIDSDDLVLNVSLSGGRVVRQCGRETTAGAGEAILLSSADAACSVVPATSRILSFRVPSDIIRPMIGDLDTCLLRTVPCDSRALRLLTGYVGVVEEKDAMATPDLRRLVVAHMHDLISMTVGATREAAAVAQGRGVRAARLRAIKRDIVEHIGDRGLSISAVAMRYRITARSVQLMFESEGVTFTEFVLRERLARAHRFLTDLRHADCTIGAIAYEAGFGDLSYFNRVFRRRFGASPSEVRASAQERRPD